MASQPSGSLLRARASAVVGGGAALGSPSSREVPFAPVPGAVAGGGGVGGALPGLVG
jgi:hypothetical protein